MDIRQIIKEEVNGWLNEALSSMSREPFPHRKVNDHRYEFDVHVPDFYDDGRDYNRVYEVTFSPHTQGDERAYSIAFGDGGYGDTNVGIPLRIMETVSNAIKDFIADQDPKILTFTPSRTRGDERRGSGTNRRLNLYNTYLKRGAGNEYDGFILGNNDRMIVEKRDSGYNPVNGEQPASLIQDILKDLSFYKGVYKTVGVPENDPRYKEFSASEWSGFVKREGGHVEKTLSPRKFVDWILSEDDIQYSDETTREYETQAQAPPQEMPADAPIQRIGGGGSRRNTGIAEVGTFQHFLNNNVYGQQDYRHLEPFFDNLDTMEKFDELKSKAERDIWTAEDKERERLEDIVRDVNRLKRAYDEYENMHNNNRTLNEIEEQLMSLVK